MPVMRFLFRRGILAVFLHRRGQAMSETAAPQNVLVPDTSEFQLHTSMSGIKSKNGGATIMRALYGHDHIDRRFVASRHDAQKNHFSFVGIYHYVVHFQDITAQAEAFCKVVGELAANEVPMLDYEEGTGGDQHDRAMVWLGIVEAKLGKRPWLYSGAFFAVDSGLAPIFNGTLFHTWVAAYGAVEPALGHTLWQCTDGRIGVNKTNWPGAGFCDTSIFHGGLADMAGLTHHPNPSPAPGGHGPREHEHTTAGKMSLADFCHQQGTSPASVLRHTAVHDKAFPSNVSHWLNAVFSGEVDVHDPMPAGLHLWIPGATEKEG